MRNRDIEWILYFSVNNSVLNILNNLVLSSYILTKANLERCWIHLNVWQGTVTIRFMHINFFHTPVSVIYTEIVFRTISQAIKKLMESNHYSLELSHVSNLS